MYSGKYKHLTLDRFFNIASSYWISPLKVKAARKTNGIRLTWSQGGDYKNENTSSFCYIEYLDKAGSVLQYREIKATKINYSINDSYWFQADVSEPILDRESLNDVSRVLLCYSPRAYKGKNGYFTPSYKRVIWEGEDFSMDKYASIDMDKGI